MSPLLRATDVAALLRVSARTFETMVKRGEAPAHFRVGRLRRWDLKGVEAWIAEQSAAATKAAAKAVTKT